MARCTSPRLELLVGPLPGASVVVDNMYQHRTGRAWLQGGDSTSSLRVELYSGGGRLLSVPWAGGTGGYVLLASQGFPVPSDCTRVVVINQGGPGNVPLNLIVETS
jgi:hypothetical protein